jgi:hypothetical protein
MNKLLQAFLILLFVTTAVQAQDAPLAQRINLRIGNAVPIGDFKKDRFEDDYPPMAKYGLGLQASYARDLKPFLAVGATGGWRRNNFDMDAFVREDDELVLSKTAGSWQTTYTLADVYLQSRPGGLFGYFKGSVGGAYSKSPELRVNTSYGPIHRSSDTAAALAYGLAAGFGVQINDFDLSLEIGTVATQPSFEVIDAQGNSTRYKQSMRTASVSVGVGYRL